MEDRIFFGKYRASEDPAGMPIELRRNASGVTCKAEEIESGREVALELVTMRKLDDETREKIEVEANAAKQLNHPNIPALYDFAFEQRDLVYVTEYFDGITAESWVTTHGPMPVRAVLRVALQVVSALGAATFQLVMHRAIHPGNILIVPGQTPEGDWPFIKVLGFGRIFSRARKFGYGTVRDKSAPFASPEQLLQGTVDFRSEIYSLGCTLWSLVTGVSPFQAPGEPLADAQMAPAMKRFSGVPRKVRRLITAMAATDPDDRPLDPIVMTEQLQACLRSVERREAFARKLGIPASWRQRRIARSVRRPFLLKPIPLAAMLLALAALSAAFLTNSPQSLWNKFTSQKPIGIPIGVPEASPVPVAKKAQATDMTTAAKEAALVNQLNEPKGVASTNTPAAVVSASPAASVVASTTQNLPNEQKETVGTVETETNESAKIASANQAATIPPPVESPPPLPNESAKIDQPPPPAPSPSPDLEASPTIAANKVPRAELIEPPPKSSAAKQRVVTAQKRDVVPRAELVEPPPPAEKPPDSADAFRNEAGSVPRAELVEPPPPSRRKSRREKPPSNSLTPSERAVIRKASRRPRITAEGDGAMVRLPDGVVHARRVGTTPDGQWMLALPSRKIMIVPPPPDYIPQ